MIRFFFLGPGQREVGRDDDDDDDGTMTALSQAKTSVTTTGSSLLRRGCGAAPHAHDHASSSIVVQAMKSEQGRVVWIEKPR